LIIKPCYHCDELGLRLFLLFVAEVAQCAEKTRRRTSSTYSVNPALALSTGFGVQRSVHAQDLCSIGLTTTRLSHQDPCPLVSRYDTLRRRGKGWRS
jgi:hypothetical protein